MWTSQAVHCLTYEAVEVELDFTFCLSSEKTRVVQSNSQVEPQKSLKFRLLCKYVSHSLLKHKRLFFSSRCGWDAHWHSPLCSDLLFPLEEKLKQSQNDVDFAFYLHLINISMSAPTVFIGWSMMESNSQVSKLVKSKHRDFGMRFTFAFDCMTCVSLSLWHNQRLAQN
jgi:hypothetical protein